ncbi:glycoside hydrolase superfamily, partial [Boeremia exigua]|uniref:glycoside hydrolase superfamily n=1 Tax=Boeremia exigua TaxID=749465 RepID=UPI001E8E8F42
CHKNGKKVLLSLGGGYPTDYYLASDDAAKWLAEVLVGAFGPQTGGNWPRPFGASAVDGFDLDIESASAVGAQKYQYYAELVNYIKKLSPGMLISGAPQCVVPDAHLDDAIARAPFDYIFTQFYNTDECSAKRGWTERNQQTTGFTFDKWAARLQEKSFNKGVKLYLGLTAGTNGGNPAHYLLPEQANDLVVKYQKSPVWGGVMLWEATVSQNNTV